MTVNDGLVSLIALVDGADFAPSDESFYAFQKVCTAMNETLQQWQQLNAKDLVAFNEILEQQKLAAIPKYPPIAVATNCVR
jgi:hypothetical protein